MNNIQTISLDYEPNILIKYFSNISHLKWSMLLTSSNSKNINNRFDILTSDPVFTLVTIGKITFIEQNRKIKTSVKVDPLSLVKKYRDIIMVNHKHIKPNKNLPFQGGALGLFGYDLGRYFEKVPNYSKVDIKTPDMAIGIYDWAIIADHHLKCLTLVSIKNIKTRFNWIKKNVINKLIHKPFKITSDWKSNFSFSEYEKSFSIIKNYIMCGDCYQINLSQRFQASYDGNEWDAFCKLNIKNAAPFSSFLRLPNSVIMSFSPERFLYLDGKKKIETRPIKGTCPRVKNNKTLDQLQALNLMQSYKNRAENLMIVDLLRNDIGKVAQPGTLKVPELFVIESFPAVHHLISTIRGVLKPNLDATDLIRACFPGGSVTGAPKIKAMEIIEQLEPYRRNAWCGSIGYLSCCGCMDINIAIRTLIAEKPNIYCSAGSGLVHDSILQDEYKEILSKLDRILPYLSKN